MEEKHIQTFDFTPLLIGFAILITILAWLFHLIKPALLVKFSPKYRSLKWVEGKPGFLEFFQLSYKCVFHAGDLFTVAYKKVISPYEG
jgi:uncharacterized membrane protein